MDKTTKFLIGLLIFVIIAVGGFLIWENYKTESDDSSKQTEVKELEKVTIGATGLIEAYYPEIQPEFYNLNYSLYVFEPLATFDRENKIVPALATHWDNPDELTWRFYLAENAKFSNGEPVTAEDVKFTYEYLLENKLPLSQLLGGISEVTVVDSKTIEFQTAGPNPIFLNRIAVNLMIMSQAEVEVNGLINYLGSGPYKFVSLNKERLEFSRNENYWGEKPKVKQVVFQAYPSEEEKIAALEKNEVDMISYGFAEEGVSATLEEAIKEGKFQKEQMLDATIIMLALDSLRQKTPGINLAENPLKDKKVRQAIYQSIDAQAIVDKLPAGGKVANQLVALSIFGYNTKIEPLAYDPEQAKKLIAEAGYENGFEMTIDYLDLPGAIDYYQLLLDQLKAINITVKLEAQEPEAYFAKIEERETSAAIFAWSSDTMDAGETLNQLIHSTSEDGEFGAYNIGYSNSDTDALIEQASKILNQKNRLPKLEEAMKAAMDDVASIPLFQSNIKYAFSNSISWKPRVDNTYRAWEMSGK